MNSIFGPFHPSSVDRKWIVRCGRGWCFSVLIFKNQPFPASFFLHFSRFNTDDSKLMFDMNWLDLNCEPSKLSKTKLSEWFEQHRCRKLSTFRIKMLKVLLPKDSTFICSRCQIWQIWHAVHPRDELSAGTNMQNNFFWCWWHCCKIVIFDDFSPSVCTSVMCLIQVICQNITYIEVTR